MVVMVVMNVSLREVIQHLDDDLSSLHLHLAEAI
jgi:hypothetical protein